MADQEELFELRLKLAEQEKTAPWRMEDLEEALKKLENGKCRDPDGLIRELFKEEVIGKDLKNSLLILYNRIKEERKLPSFMNFIDISAIYKGKGELNDLDSDRGIFLVSIFQTILMKIIYKDKYEVIEASMSDSNIGARKGKNIRNHIFVVNSVIHDVLSKKTKEPIDIMVLDYKQMFDSECLYECMNDLYEAGIKDDIFALIYEANRENQIAVKTPNGITRREKFSEIVMQGDVLAPLMSSLQVDTMGKECLEEVKHLYYYKGTVPIPPLGMVDDLFTISTCGFRTTMVNEYINFKTAMKKLQFGTSKCVKLHVGKTCNKNLCKDLFVDEWKVEAIENENNGQVTQIETFVGKKKMVTKTEQLYLGDVISEDGKHDKNIKARENKSIGIISQIMQILESVLFGKYYFEVALILRSSLLLSSILLNSEAWVNVTDKNIRDLEKIDENLLSKIMNCDRNTSNAFKYLELGVYPIRFEVKKRKILFLHYLLNQEKSSMINQVLQATINDPIKNDFVQTCKKYMKEMNIHMSFEDFGKLSKWKARKLVKEKVTENAFKYLTEEKNKQKKISKLEYKRLSIQEYLEDGDKNNEVSKVIFKARSLNLDIKLHKKWKYEDKLCIGCGKNEESGEELLRCEGFIDKKDGKIGLKDIKNYSKFFYGSVKEMTELAMDIRKRLRRRENIINGIG